MAYSSELKEEISLVVAAIDNAFEIEGDLAEADVEALHARLVACIDKVNKRLQACDDLLRKGLKVEAIHEVEIAPNLLELVNDLDAMSAWDGWADYVRQFGIPPQPDVLVEIAAELNLAYSQSQPIEKLLRLHRLYALARAPLKERIPVLRELLKREPSEAWKKDLKDYENARLRQIQLAGRAAVNEKQTKVVADLVAELGQPVWSAPPPKTLVDELSSSLQRLQVEEATDKLNSLAVEMDKAFQEFDLPTGRLARDEWYHQNEVAQLPENSPVVQQAQAALNWLDDEDQVEQMQLDLQRAVAELEQGLDNDHTKRSELVRLFSAVERFDEPIADRLSRRYSERLHSLATAERRKTILMLISSVVVVITAGSLIALFAFLQIRSNKVVRFQDAVAGLLKQAKLDEAETLFGNLGTGDGYILNDPAVQKLRAELDRLTADEASRRQVFTNHLQAVIEATVEAASWEQVDLATAELAKADTIARLESEKVELRVAERELRKITNGLQTKLDEDFQRQVKQLVDAKLNINRLDRAAIHELILKAQELAKPSRVSPSVKTASRIDTLAKSFKDAESSLEKRSTGSQIQTRLVATIGNSTSYRSAMNEYKNFLVSGARAADLKEVLESEISLIEDLTTGWNPLIERWNGRDFSGTPDYAQFALALISEVTNKFGDLPPARFDPLLTNYLKSVLTRQNGSKSDKYESLLLTYLDSNVFKLKYATGTTANGNPVEVFFNPRDKLPTNVDANGVFPIVPVSVSNPLATRSSVRARFTIVEAPHVTLAGQLNEILKTNGGTSPAYFEQNICRCLYLIFKTPNLKPLMRGEMLQRFATEPLNGSSVLNGTLNEYRVKMAAMDNFKNADWGNVDDPKIKNSSEIANKLISALEDPLAIYKNKINPQMQQLMDAVGKKPTIRWIGALFKDDSKSEPTWVCEFPQPIRTSQSIELYIRFQESGRFRTLRVGELVSGKLKLDEKATAHFKEGRPVWIFVP